MSFLFAIIDPNAEIGPVGLYIGAGFLTLVSLGTLVTGVHPRFRPAAKWQGGSPRSAFGSIAFSTGLLIMCAGLVVRGLLNQHGPFAGVALYLLCGGVALSMLGPVYDLVQNSKKH